LVPKSPAENLQTAGGAFPGVLAHSIRVQKASPCLASSDFGLLAAHALDAKQADCAQGRGPFVGFLGDAGAF